MSIKRSTKSRTVNVEMRITDEVADVMARFAWKEVNTTHSPQSSFKALERAGVTQQELAQYFKELVALTSLGLEYENDLNRNEHGFYFRELRELFMPVIFGTVLGTIGPVTIGDYEVKVLSQSKATEIVNRDHILEMSRKLEELTQQGALTSMKGQIGHYNHVGTVEIMAQVIIQDGQNAVFTQVKVEPRHASIAAAAGLHICEETQLLLYPRLIDADVGGMGNFEVRNPNDDKGSTSS